MQPLRILVGRAGFEPATNGLKVLGVYHAALNINKLANGVVSLPSLIHAYFSVSQGWRDTILTRRYLPDGLTKRTLGTVSSRRIDTLTFTLITLVHMLENS